jgi:hypothetical protein
MPDNPAFWFLKNMKEKRYSSNISAAGNGDRYTLHVHTAYIGERYTLHVRVLAVEGTNFTSTVLKVERNTPCMSTLLKV